MPLRTPFLAILIACWPAPTHAVVRTTTGTEPDLWNSHAVVYAEILAIAHVEDHVHEVTLEVKATLAGAIDPSVRHQLVARLRHGLALGIGDPPPPKSRVVVFVHQTKEGQFTIPARSVLFMPTGRPILVVSAFDDPKVQKVVTVLGLVRTLENDRANNIVKRLKESLGTDFWEKRP